MRRTTLAGLNSGSPVVLDNFGYDNASRLQTATDNTAATPYSASYTYLANSPLVSQISFANNGSTRMTTTKQYDFLNRFTQISSAPSAATPVTFNYEYNAANQRTRRIQGDGSYWRYQYDSLGQVTSGKKYWSDQTPAAGQQFGYSFDDIGNRTQTLAGGDQTGANERSASYYANTLNQYTNRTVPGYVDVTGLAYATNPVTVNGTTAYRHGEYFRQELSVVNSSTSVWDTVTVAAAGQTTITGGKFVPKTPELFGYDLDGNLTSDGRWNYAWDAENRLISLAVNTTNGPQQSLMFEYDSKSRRVRKQVWGNTGWSGSPTNDLKFVYDGWNLLAELNAANSPARTYLWGLDLSGSIQGAGGVGGLLEMVYYGSSTTNCFAAFDGNGNVAGLVNAADGTTLAQYGYGPFGEVIRATGPMAKANTLRFSTKYADDETDLIRYEPGRYYAPSWGAWLSRDRSGEVGGPNLRSFVLNDSVDLVDPFGLRSYPRGHFDVDIQTYHYYSDVIIAYTAGSDSHGCPKCRNIKLAQTVTTIYEDLFGNILFGDNPKLDTTRNTRPWYLYQQSQYGYVSMTDSPGIRWYYPPGPQIYGVTQYFETCAFCADDRHIGLLSLGCASWGHSVGGFRHSWHWGAGRNLIPVPPTVQFFWLFMGLR